MPGWRSGSCGIVVAAAGLTISRPLWSDILPPSSAMAPLLAVLISFTAAEAGTAIAQVAGRFHGFALSGLLVRLFQVGLLLAAVTDWRMLAFAAAAGWTLSAAWSLSRVPRGIWTGLTMRWAEISLIVRHGWAIPAASLAAVAMTAMDAWFVAAFHDTHEAGLYGMAYSVSLLGMALLTPLSAVLTPAAVADRISGNADLSRRLTFYAAATALCCAFAPIVLALCAGLLEVVDIGQYEAAVPAAIILGAAVLCQLPISLLEPALYAQERHIPKAAAAAVAMALTNAARTCCWSRRSVRKGLR